MARLSLHLDWCDRKAAVFACKHWHPLEPVPSVASNRIGVWEEGDFRGCLVFIRAMSVLSAQFGLTQHETIELSRFARWKLKTPMTRVMSIALGIIREKNPDARIVVALVEDPHVGIVYQAASWVYLGKDFPGGNRHHVYARPLDRDAGFLLEGLSLPYPRSQTAARVS